MACRFCHDTGWVCVEHGLPSGHEGCDDGEYVLCPDPACPKRRRVYDERFASTNPDATHRTGDALDDEHAWDHTIDALSATTPGAAGGTHTVDSDEGHSRRRGARAAASARVGTLVVVDGELLWSQVFGEGDGASWVSWPTRSGASS